MRITLKIKRFNPETDKTPHWESYPVEVEPTDRVLDALHQVKWYHDGTFNLRRSCRHIFHRAGDNVSDGLGGNASHEELRGTAEEASFTSPSLTSCCVARFLTGTSTGPCP